MIPRYRLRAAAQYNARADLLRVPRKPMSDRPAPNQFDARVKAVFRHRVVARDLALWHLDLAWPPGDEPDLSRIEALP